MKAKAALNNKKYFTKHKYTYKSTNRALKMRFRF